MKKLIIAICYLAFASVAGAQTSMTKVSKKNRISTTKYAAVNAIPQDSSESLSLQEKEFNFGKIPQGKPVTHIFKFVNKGTEPFALSNVQTSCGCTTPVWNKDTVEVGQASEIKVGYNAANEGPFNKTITITWNGDKTQQITIKGEVWKTPATSAPVNTALLNLKNQQ